MQVKKFEVEHAWLLLRDESKWHAEFMDNTSNKSKVCASGAYSSSF